MLSRFSQTTAAASTTGHVYQARFEVQVEKGQHVPCKPLGEKELGIVQEARIWRPIPMGADLLRRPAVGAVLSEAMKGHWTKKGNEWPLSTPGLRRPSAFGSDWRRGKVRLAFRLHTASPDKDRPKYVSLSASQWLSRSGIPRPPLRVRWMQICLTDHRPSASPE